MSARIDHAAEAWDLLIGARDAAAPEQSTAFATAANALATLALVEQQRIANMQVEVSRLRVRANLHSGTDAGVNLSDQAYALEARIREGLGL